MMIYFAIVTRATIEIKSDVSWLVIFFVFIDTNICQLYHWRVRLYRLRVSRGVYGNLSSCTRACTLQTYTQASAHKRACGSAPFVRARADAWVRATRERCAGRLFRYCCYCWGNNRPSIGRLGTMYLFRCGQRCSIDQDPPSASLEKVSREQERSSSEVFFRNLWYAPQKCVQNIFLFV